MRPVPVPTTDGEVEAEVEAEAAPEGGPEVGRGIRKRSSSAARHDDREGPFQSSVRFSAPLRNAVSQTTGYLSDQPGAFSDEHLAPGRRATGSVA
jgi:hypothetical protein